MEIKDYLRETNATHARLVGLVAFLLLLVLLLGLRVWYLQIARYQKFEVLSKDNRVRLVAVPPLRGQIYDRNGKVLAENQPVFTLEIVPLEVKDMDLLLEYVSRIVKISPAEIGKFKKLVAANQSFESQVLKSNLSEEEVARFAVNQHRFIGASVQARLQRHYPHGGELVHALGYVGRINQRDMEKINTKAYKGTRYIGKLGIEAKYEDVLLGEVGFEQIESNAHGRKVRTLERHNASSGSDIYLNIDADLQIKSRKYLQGKRGAVIAIEPASGEVLAFVSNPVYDPNKFVNGIDHASYNALRDDINRPLLNRALNGRYAPGSTIKGLMALTGLENGWNKNTSVYCPGFFKLKGVRHQYRCWKRQGHGNLDLKWSIMRSCDVFYYNLANTLGITKLHAFLNRFGIGKATGIDLIGEPTGLMPSSQWKRRVKNEVWYPGETLITGIGQGYILVTPLQLSALTATLANRGKRIEPRLVNRLINNSHDGHADVVKVTGDTLDEIKLKSTTYYNTVIEAMQAVVEHPRGTAHRIGLDKEYTMAGKTGTAQVVAIAQGANYDESKLDEFQKDHALFIAFAPVEDPKIAVAVIVENGGSGSSVAAPVARKVLDYYLTGKDADNEPEQVPENGIETIPQAVTSSI